MRATSGGDFVSQQMAAQTGFGALGIFELDDAHPLDGLFPHPEKAGGHLGDDMIVIRDQRHSG